MSAPARLAVVTPSEVARVDAPPLLGPAGTAALAALMRGRPLLAFDFDGTLAPIVERPDDARLPPATAERLARLAARRPVAVVTGRALADVRRRLGFTPAAVVGNHGAEDAGDPARTAALTTALDDLRARLGAEAARLAALGVTVEDKGASIALHRRGAPDPDAAAAHVARLLAQARSADAVDIGGGLRVFSGKMVDNVAAADAPDKAAAVERLRTAFGCDTVFFAGDDVNDEPVFEAAAADWVTVRVGPGRDGGPPPASAARWSLPEPQAMPAVLDLLLAAADA